MVWELPTNLDALEAYLTEFLESFNNLRAAKNRPLGSLVLFALEDGGYAEMVLVDKSSTSSFIQKRPVDIHTFNDNTTLEMNRNSRQREFGNRGELIYAVRLNRGIIAELGGPVAFARKVDAELEKPQPAKVPASSQATGSKVLIIHGRNHAVRDKINLYLQSLKLEALVMEAGAHRGRTMAEKFEEVAGECGYAVFILTADDHLKDLSTGKEIKRARQNVILEVGYMWSAIGRDRAAFLVDQDELMDLPSDIAGIGWIAVTPDLGETKLKLREELEAAGLL